MTLLTYVPSVAGTLAWNVRSVNDPAAIVICRSHVSVAPDTVGSGMPTPPTVEDPATYETLAGLVGRVSRTSSMVTALAPLLVIRTV